MRTPSARAASLCVAAFVALALLPAAAQAQEPTQHRVWWPGNLATAGTYVPGSPELLNEHIISTPGLCPAVGESKTFSFSYADQGVVLGADGQFSEHGSFTLVATPEDTLVSQFDSTYSGSSPNGTIEGKRHLEESLRQTTGTTCMGTSDEDRHVAIIVTLADTQHRLTSASTGAVTIERGWSEVHVSSRRAPIHTGKYFSRFRSDEDGDRVDLTDDNCPNHSNGDQLDGDGDGIGDACDGPRDSDGDLVFDPVDNCVSVANANQANLDGDANGDACDPDDDADGIDDARDNCPTVSNPAQHDTDSDGVGDACRAFASNDGFAGGGGRLAGDVHVSVALHSHGGRLNGSGELADGATRLRLLDLTALRSDGDRVVATGAASINGGAAVPYRLVIADSTNTFELEAGDRRWAGSLAHGNLVVR